MSHPISEQERARLLDAPSQDELLEHLLDIEDGLTLDGELRCENRYNPFNDSDTRFVFIRCANAAQVSTDLQQPFTPKALCLGCYQSRMRVGTLLTGK